MNRSQNEAELVNIAIVAGAAVCTLLQDDGFVSNKRLRKGNEHRDREYPIKIVDGWDDTLFMRQFRIARCVFNNLIGKIEELHTPKEWEIKEEMGRRSSGSHVSLKLKLMVTLRLLAGASYLDMIWYGIGLESVHPMFVTTLDRLNRVLDNVRIPDTNEKWAALAERWSIKMMEKRLFDILPGTVLAGDGLAIPIVAPDEKDRGGLDLSKFRNRKGFYALIVQAFCDCDCKFVYFDVSWPGACNDITCYKQTSLYNKYITGAIPAGYHFVLDEAYSSIGGDTHLTPYSRSQLKAAMNKIGVEEYCKRKAFNNMLSSQRITIERAFGIFIRKWGIFWKPLEFSLRINSLILLVCSKLHNLCIDYYQTNITSDILGNLKQGSDWMLFEKGVYNPSIREDLYGEQNDSSILENWENTNHIKSRSATIEKCSKREQLKNHVFQCGIVYHYMSDNDFTLN